jgi:hypothetical protein
VNLMAALSLFVAAGAGPQPIHLYPQAPPPAPGYVAPAPPPPAPAHWPPAWLVVDPNRKPPKEATHGHSSLHLSGHHCRGGHGHK